MIGQHRLQQCNFTLLSRAERCIKIELPTRYKRNLNVQTWKYVVNPVDYYELLLKSTNITDCLANLFPRQRYLNGHTVLWSYKYFKMYLLSWKKMMNEKSFVFLLYSNTLYDFYLTEDFLCLCAWFILSFWHCMLVSFLSSGAQELFLVTLHAKKSLFLYPTMVHLPKWSHVQIYLRILKTFPQLLASCQT